MFNAEFYADVDSICVPASPASQIAGIDKQKINEAGYSGHMPCLPKTTAGLARTFSFFDLVALRVYAHFFRDGLALRTSGEIACRARQMLEADRHNGSPTLEWAVIFPHNDRLTGKGRYRGLPFKANDAYRPQRTACLENSFIESGFGFGTGYYINCVEHMDAVAKAMDKLGISADTKSAR